MAESKNGPAAAPGLMARLRRLIRPVPETRARGRALIGWHETGVRWTARRYAALADEGYARNVVVHRAVGLVARGVAAIPWIARDAGGREIAVAAFDVLLRRPNPRDEGTAFLEALTAHLLIAGNAYVEAVGPGTRPREWHLLRPDRVTVRPGPGGVPAGFEHREGEETRFIPVDGLTGRSPVLHLKTFHPLDDWHGLPALEAAAQAIDQHNAAGAWNKALLDNAARPSGALVYQPKEGPASLADDQFDRLKSEIAEQFEGARNAGRPLLLDGGLDWRALSLTPAEMDWIEGRNAAAREIALAFGVPPQLVGVPDAQTYANYAEARLALYEDTVVPLAQSIARAFARAFGAGFGIATLEPDLDEVPALEPRRAERWVKVRGAADLTRDERRAALGYGPIGKDEV
ncbi:phage portal protein [Zavarzinia compransoris]|uniref:phage portal protein n=1 Tax=Zavarzinia marina TaxID=2911065 RepID=UPI001F4651A1|nr:phage portal protein [Zavarzinia marina]MCF4166482.1 phage portal protein [Zavarzinia marina]